MLRPTMTRKFVKRSKIKCLNKGQYSDIVTITNNIKYVSSVATKREAAATTSDVTNQNGYNWNLRLNLTSPKAEDKQG